MMNSSEVEHFYFNKRITARLNRICILPMTLVRGCAGAGKTTAINAYVSSVGAQTIWHHCEEDDFSAFYRQFTDYFSVISQETGKLMKEKMPDATPGRMAVRAAAIIRRSLNPRRFVYVLETHRTALPAAIREFLYTLGCQRVSGFFVVVSMRTDSAALPETIIDANVNVIEEDDFRLNKEEIILFFQQYGMQLSWLEAEWLYLTTEGWIPGLSAFGNAVQKYGKRVAFRNAKIIMPPVEQSVEYACASAPHGCVSPKKTAMPAENQEWDEIIRLVKRLDFQEASIAAEVFARKTEEQQQFQRAAFILAFLDVMNGKAEMAMNRLRERITELRLAGRKAEAEETLFIALQMNVLLGEDACCEMEALADCSIERWLRADVFSPLIACMALLYIHQYTRAAACAHGCNDPVAEEFILAAAYLHLDGESGSDAAEQHFRKAQDMAMESGDYLSALLLYDLLADFLIRPFAAGFWEEKGRFRDALMRFHRSVMKNDGQHLPGRYRLLTVREREAVRLAQGGMTNKEIALRLKISENTVKTALKVSFRKLGVHSRKELAGFHKG